MARDPPRRIDFRIIAPLSGDVYRLPPGIDARYATIGLRAVGGRGEPRWFVDGEPLDGVRWRLTPGRHTVRAESRTSESDEVHITVEALGEVAKVP